MSIKKIITIPDPILRQISEPVKSFDKEIKKLSEDMLETMYEAPGIGLAAVQVGVLKRVIVIDVSKKTRSCVIPMASIKPGRAYPSISAELKNVKNLLP